MSFASFHHILSAGCPGGAPETILTSLDLSSCSLNCSLAEMGVADSVLKMILNHSLGSDITGVYNQYKYFEERKQALDAWAKRLTVIVSALKAVAH